MPLDTALRKQIENRLRREGRFQPYLHVRRFLTNSGIPLREAWRVAAMGFDPIDGSKPEIIEDKRYAEIRTRIARGDFPQPPDFPRFPNGLIDYREPPKETPELKALAEEAKEAPRRYTNKFEKVAARLDPTVYAPELDQVRWAMNHCYVDIDKIDPRTIPSLSALKVLEVVSGSGRDALEIIKLYLTKAMPSKDAQAGNTYSDDGRQLAMLEEFERDLAERENVKATSEQAP